VYIIDTEGTYKSTRYPEIFPRSISFFVLAGGAFAQQLRMKNSCKKDCGSSSWDSMSGNLSSVDQQLSA
jgi:hypothetical protein